MLRELCAPVKSLPGTKFALAGKGIRPVQVSALPLHVVFPPLFKVGNWVLSCKLGSTLTVLSEVHRHCTLIPPSIPIIFVAVLGTTLSSGRHTPSTCPNGLKLVEHQESCSSRYFSANQCHTPEE